MIKIICGPKGSGKTKRIIDAANGAVDTAKGHLIFITDTKRYMYDLRREVRFIDVSDYSVAGKTRCAASSRASSQAATITNSSMSTAWRASRARPSRIWRSSSTCSRKSLRCALSPSTSLAAARKRNFLNSRRSTCKAGRGASAPNISKEHFPVTSLFHKGRFRAFQRAHRP